MIGILHYGVEVCNPGWEILAAPADVTLEPEFGRQGSPWWPGNFVGVSQGRRCWPETFIGVGPRTSVVVRNF